MEVLIIIIFKVIISVSLLAILIVIGRMGGRACDKQTHIVEWQPAGSNYWCLVARFDNHEEAADMLAECEIDSAFAYRMRCEG